MNTDIDRPPRNPEATTLARSPREALLALLLQESEREAPPALPASVVPIQPAGRRAAVFGVGVFHFRTLARQLGSERPFYGLLGSDLDEEGEYMGRVEALAARYVEDIHAVQPDGPYHLCGFCFGGLVAYEIACQLEAAGDTVGMLLLIDTYHPATFDAEDTRGARAVREKVAARLQRIRAEGPRHLVSWFRERRRYEATRWRTRCQMLLARTWRRVGRPVPEWLEGADTYREDLAAARRYEPREYGGDLTLVISVPSKPEAASGAFMDLPSVARAGWRPLVDGDLRVVTAESEVHMDVLSEPRVTRLAAEMQAALDRADPPVSQGDGVLAPPAPSPSVGRA